MSKKIIRSTKTSGATKQKISAKQSTDDETSIIVEEPYVHVELTKRTPPYMSHYEYCALIAARVSQLTSRSPEWNIPKVSIDDLGSFDPLVIATAEVNQRLVSLVVRRKLPDGTTEDWSLKDLIFPRI